MTSVAVVAHTGKNLDGGLPELRDLLSRAGVEDAAWFEVSKTKRAPACVRDAVAGGADLLFVWGGDGMVQRCLDAVGDAPVAVAILPAGTGNLLARNLGVPLDLERAVDVGLHGVRRTIDVGCVNGERFAVMAGAGFDALMIRDAGRSLKRRFGRAAYVWSGARHLRVARFDARIDVDGHRWFDGPAGCVLVGNVSKLVGGIEVFDGALADDGRLELGVVTAKGVVQWLRALARAAIGRTDRSPFVQTTKGRRIDVRLDRKVPHELDGGVRKGTKRLRIRVQPAAVTVCVPEDEHAGEHVGASP